VTNIKKARKSRSRFNRDPYNWTAISIHGRLLWRQPRCVHRSEDVTIFVTVAPGYGSFDTLSLISLRAGKKKHDRISMPSITGVFSAETAFPDGEVLRL
jgi:hypothetical protein